MALTIECFLLMTVLVAVNRPNSILTGNRNGLVKLKMTSASRLVVKYQVI